jgi:hypothetical protein
MLISNSNSLGKKAIFLGNQLNSNKVDIIKKKAEDFAKYQFLSSQIDSDDIISSTRNKLYEIDNVLDKIKFLNIVLDTNSSKYDKHKKVCRDPETCGINASHEEVTYFLGQELSRLGVCINDDTFTVDDKMEAEDKLDKIISEIQTLKDGHQIIYDQLVNEITELKELYYLGKKKWYRQLIGTGAEMAVGGIISETVSKKIIEIVKGEISKLLV